MTRKTITVSGFDRAIDEFIQDVKRLDRGELAESVDTITFVSWDALAAAMTPRRFALLRYLKGHPVASIRALSRGLGRDFKNVHQDLAALERLGLVVRRDGQWQVDYDEIQASIKLTDAA